MTFHTPQERIAAAIWPPDDPDFHEACNRISPYVELEIERAELRAYSYLMTKDAHDQASALFLRNLILDKRKSVDAMETRIRLLEASQDKVRPIRP